MRSIKTSNIANVVCRIDIAKEQGTGVLYRYNEDYIFLFTCAHVIRDTKEFKILFKSHSIDYQLNISEGIEFFIDSNNDAAIVKIPMTQYEILKDIPAVLAIIDDDGDGKLLCGYPEVLNRSEINCSILDDGRSNNHIFRTTINLDTYTSEGLENAKGLSGGGVFSNNGDILYLEGVIKKYSNEFKFFEYIPMELYNTLLNIHGYNPIPVGGRLLHAAIELTESSLKELEGIRSVIASDIELKREVMGELSCTKNKCCIVTGEPGAGKSVLVRNYLLENNFPFFFFKSAQVQDRLLESLDIINCYSMYEKKDVFLIIDAAEKIFDMLNEEHLVKAIKVIQALPNLKLIISVRSYSLEALKKVLIFDCNFKELNTIQVENLNDKEFAGIEKKYPDIKILSSKAKELIKNPFYLDVVIKEKLIGNLSDIRNEFQIKDLIWNSITENNTNMQKALINLAIKKLELKREFVELEMEDSIESVLVSKQIINKSETLYRFAHDKYEDIADKKMFDKWHLTKEMPEILLDLGNKLPYGRAYKNWISDRLSNGEICKISVELEQIYQNTSISYIWKWNTFESIYQSPNLIDFLNLNKDKIKEDRDFIKRIYEISVTTNFVELHREDIPPVHLKLYFSMYVKPSLQLVHLINFFSNNGDCINDKNRYYIIKILVESAKLLPILKKRLINLMPNVMELTMSLIEGVRVNTYSRKSQLLKGILHSFISYAPYFKDRAQTMLLKIIDEDEFSFDHDFIESVLILSEGSEERVVISEEFVEVFYDMIERIYKEKSVNIEDSLRLHGVDFEEASYNLNRSLGFIVPYSFKTQFYTMFKVDFKRTLNYVIEFINERCQFNYNYRRRPKANEIGGIDFVYKNHISKLHNNGNHYLAYRGGSGVPGFIESILMTMERILLEKSEVEDLSNILEKILVESNNLMLIGVVLSIVLKDYKKYGLIFINLLPNYYLRRLEISRYMNENLNLKSTLYSRDHLAKADRKKYDDLPHRKEQFDIVFCNLQQIKDYKESAFLMIDRLKSELTPEDDEYIEKYNFLYKNDLRNFVYTGHQEGFNIYEAKEIDQNEVKKALEKKAKDQILFSEYLKLSNLVTLNNISEIDREEVVKLIQNYRTGRYNSVDRFMEDQLKVSISAFYILNPELQTMEQYEKEIQNCVEKGLNVVKNDVYAQGKLVIDLSKAFLSLNEYYLNKHHNDILYFFYLYLIKNQSLAYGTIQVCNLLRCHNGNANNLIKRLVKLLIKYMEYDPESLRIQQRLSVGESIKTDELRKADEAHQDSIVKLLRSGKEPESNKVGGYDTDRLYVSYSIANISNHLTRDMVLEVFLKLLNQIMENKKERWIKHESVHYESALKDFIVFCIKDDKYPKELIDFINLNLPIFYKIVGEVADTLAAYVHDGYLEKELGWTFIKEALVKLTEYEEKANLISHCKGKFTYNMDHLNFGRLLEHLFLSNSSWIYQINPESIKIFEGHEKDYFDFIMKFIDSPVALKIFAKILVNYPKQFNCFFVFDYFDPLLKSLLNPEIYDEDDLLWYWESVIENILMKYNDLKATDRDRFYALLTAIGCNAPSSFALFLRKKIEY